MAAQANLAHLVDRHPARSSRVRVALFATLALIITLTSATAANEPPADFLTPNEGATVIQSGSEYQVSWDENSYVGAVSASNPDVYLPLDDADDRIPAAYSEAVLDTPGLSRYYRLGDSANPIVDSVAGLNATANVNTSLNQSAYIPDGNGSAGFNGSNSNIQLNNTLGNLFSGSFTFETWAYFNNDSRAILIGDYQMANNVGINFEKQTSRRLRLYWDNGAADITTPADVVPLAQWTHLAVMRDEPAGQVRFYVDGRLVYTRVIALSDQVATGVHRIGSDNRTGSTVMYGKLDEFAIYNTAVSEATLAAHHASARIDAQGLIGQNARVHGDITLQTSGPLNGQAMTFTEPQSYVEFDQPLGSLFSGSLTFETWAYFDGTSRDIIIGDYEMHNAVGISLEKTTDQRLRLYWANGSSDIETQANVVPLNQWTHIAVTRDKSEGQVKFYIDGALVHTRNVTMVDRTATGVHRLGMDNRTGTTTMAGRLAHFAIYSYSLAAADVSDHAAAEVWSRSVQRMVAEADGNNCPTDPELWNTDGAAVTEYGTINETDLEDGSCYRWDITTTDEAGTTTIASGEVLIDATAPQVIHSFAHPDASNPPYPAGELTITSTFSEPLSGAPTLTINNEGTAVVSGATMTATASPLAWTYTYTITHAGDYGLVLSATDLAGNQVAALPGAPVEALHGSFTSELEVSPGYQSGLNNWTFADGQARFDNDVIIVNDPSAPSGDGAVALLTSASGQKTAHSEPVAVTPGTQVTVGGDWRLSGHGTRLRLCFDVGGCPSSATLGNLTGSTLYMVDWITFELEGMAPAGASEAYLAWTVGSDGYSDGFTWNVLSDAADSITRVEVTPTISVNAPALINFGAGIPADLLPVAFTVNVATNNATGYALTVQGNNLAGASEIIAIEQMEIRADAASYAAFANESTIIPLASSPERTAASGADHALDARLGLPFVESGTYEGSLLFSASTN